MATTASPSLSAILITPDNFERLQRTIAALHAQTIRDQIELVLVGPPAARLSDEAAFADFHSHQVVSMRKSEFTSAEAWAEGVVAAQAPVVVLCEDHSYPDSTWARLLLEAHRQPWAVVGPSVRNGNPQTLVSWADFFIGYGEWTHPTDSGSREHLPGHNSSYKRDLLLAYGPDLASRLDAETLLHWELRRQGHQLFLQADAVTSHINFSHLKTAIIVAWWQGWRFAAARAAAWRWPRRLLWVFGSLLIPFVRLRRIYREIRRPGRFNGSLPGLVAILGLVLLVDGVGQMAGTVFGTGRSDLRLSNLELHADARANKQPVQSIAARPSPRQLL